MDWSLLPVLTVRMYGAVSVETERSSSEGLWASSSLFVVEGHSVACVDVAMVAFAPWMVNFALCMETFVPWMVDLFYVSAKFEVCLPPAHAPLVFVCLENDFSDLYMKGNLHQYQDLL